MKILLVCLLLLSVSGADVSAQPLPEPIFDTDVDLLPSIKPDAINWTPDSHSLIFRVRQHNGLPDAVYEYTIDSGLLISIEQEPFFVKLGSSAQARFHATSDPVFIAPDRVNFVYGTQFIVPVTNHGGGAYQVFALGNLLHKTFLVLTQSYPSHIYWSEEGSTFVFTRISANSVTKSFTHLRSSDECAIQFCSLDSKLIGFVEASQTLFDLSADGKRVLLPPEDGSMGLRLWDMERDGDMFNSDDPYALVIDDSQVIGAAFIPDNDEQILMVSEQGIVRYTLTDGSSEVINPDINSTWASWVTFSPDNRWVAILAGTTASPERLYVLEAAS